jgi:hypothetical protein
MRPPAKDERRQDARGHSTGGIIIPDTAKEKPQEGKVVARRFRTRPASPGCSSPPRPWSPRSRRRMKGGGKDDLPRLTGLKE